MITYKGFDKDFKCRGVQYEVGKEYDMSEEDIEICKRGFHACESPLEVLDHYPIFDGKGNSNRFAEVEQSGYIDNEPNSTKVCSSKIHIKAELSLAGLIKAGVDWILNSVKRTTLKEGEGELHKGDFSGNSAKIGSSGNFAQIGSSGNSAQIGSSGNSAQIGSSGNSAKIGSSGNSAQIGSSGNFAQIGSSGDYAQIGSSGNYAQIGSSGNSAKIGSSGNFAQINSTGADSVICCAGTDCAARAKKGSWITLSEWVYDEEKKRKVPVMVKTIHIDGKRYKADTWYKLVNKKITEVK